jgi:hypothetical protein
LFADDSVDVITRPTSGVVFVEANGTAVFSLVLASEPSSSVRVNVGSSDTTEGSLGNVSAITFIKSSWSSQRAVTVTGVDDDVVDGNITFSIVVGAATSSDTNYDGIDGTDVSVTAKDGDNCVKFFLSLPHCINKRSACR